MESCFFFTIDFLFFSKILSFSSQLFLFSNNDYFRESCIHHNYSFFYSFFSVVFPTLDFYLFFQFCLFISLLIYHPFLPQKTTKKSIKKNSRGGCEYIFSLYFTSFHCVYANAGMEWGMATFYRQEHIFARLFQT